MKGISILSLQKKNSERTWNHNTDAMTTSISKEELPPYTMEELNARIDEAEAQFERGEYVTHEQMMDELKEEWADTEVDSGQ